ncbi:hypothetical protein ACFQU1_23650 [Chelatococcus sp. GCM10030263]|uniref:hypothetical protein n=1 Tax=Chelatococcus sp. GCM10030263 TaxID=3273387 RepID=UPI00361BF169
MRRDRHGLARRIWLLWALILAGGAPIPAVAQGCSSRLADQAAAAACRAADEVQRNAAALPLVEIGLGQTGLAASLHAPPWNGAAFSGALDLLRLRQLNGAPAVPSVPTDVRLQVGVRAQGKPLSQADVLWFQAAFAEGAFLYFGQAETPLAARSDLARNPEGLAQSLGWGFSSALLHQWMPSLRQNFFASFALVGPPQAPLRAADGVGDLGFFRTGSSLVWSPTDGVDLGLEVLYRHVGEVSRRRVNFMDPSAEGTVDARLRLQTDF